VDGIRVNGLTAKCRLISDGEDSVLFGFLITINNVHIYMYTVVFETPSGTSPNDRARLCIRVRVCRVPLSRSNRGSEAKR